MTFSQDDLGDDISDPSIRNNRLAIASSVASSGHVCVECPLFSLLLFLPVGPHLRGHHEHQLDKNAQSDSSRNIFSLLRKVGGHSTTTVTRRPRYTESTIDVKYPLFSTICYLWFFSILFETPREFLIARNDSRLESTLVYNYFSSGREGGKKPSFSS